MSNDGIYRVITKDGEIIFSADEVIDACRAFMRELRQYNIEQLGLANVSFSEGTDESAIIGYDVFDPDTVLASIVGLSLDEFTRIAKQGGATPITRQ